MHIKAIKIINLEGTEATTMSFSDVAFFDWLQKKLFVVRYDENQSLIVGGDIVLR